MITITIITIMITITIITLIIIITILLLLLLIIIIGLLLLWKSLQGKLPTGQYLFNWKFVQSPNCIYYANKNTIDDLMHIFIECDRLKPLFDCIYANIHKLLDDENIPMECYLIGLTRHRKKSVVYHHVNLTNWMTAIAKVAIVQSLYNRFKGSGIYCALMLYVKTVGTFGYGI